MDQEPIFIKIEDFNEVSKVLEDIRKKTEKVKAKLDELKKTKEKEEKSIVDWEERINKLVEKVTEIETAFGSKTGV